MNRQVHFTKRVKTSDGLRFCPVIIAPNGRVKPDWILIAGKEERHPEGAYYLEWYEGSKRIRQSVGKDAATAAAKRHRQEQVLKSKAAGIKLVDESKAVGPLLADAVVSYLQEIKSSKKPKTHSAYSTVSTCL
jgi:integrase/recombinase XerD